jgi:hypothetical protein
MALDMSGKTDRAECVPLHMLLLTNILQRLKTNTQGHGNLSRHDSTCPICQAIIDLAVEQSTILNAACYEWLFVHFTPTLQSFCYKICPSTLQLLTVK